MHKSSRYTSFIMILFDYNYFRTIAAIVTIFLFYVGRRGGTGGGLWGSGGRQVKGDWVRYGQWLGLGVGC